MASRKTTTKRKKQTKSSIFDLRELRDRAERLLKTVKTRGEKYARNSYETCKEFAEDMINDPGRTVTGVIDNGKEFVSDLKKDTRKKIKSIVKKGKKYRDEFPTMKTIENKISKRLKAVPARVNLASKQDIEKLIRSMEALNKKLDTLNSKYST